MTAKTNLLVLVLVIAIAGAGAFFIGRLTGHDPAAGGGAGQTLYTCGMHPQVIQDHPGNCPICGMKLTRIQRPTGTGSAPGAPAATSSAISIDPVTIQNMGIRTELVTNGPLRRVIRTVGTVDYNEPELADVTTKFKGWIETLYVDSTGQQVHKGEPLFEIYSPELYSAQTEYLLALSGAAVVDPTAGSPLLESARLKLRFFDISDEQIAELERTRQPKKTLRVAAPIDGFVTEKMAVEGMMAEAGAKLYRLANLGLVWVYAEVYEQDLPFIQLGQEALVTLTYLTDRHFRGRVTYVYPTVDKQTRTARVRMEFHNPGYLLKPGMFTSVELRADLAPSAVLAPDTAILRSGERNTVFVALEEGKFEPRTVTLGPRAENDMYSILSGLKPGERVVTSGQFMLDSESQLREAIQKMLHAGGSGPAGGSVGPAAPPSAAAAASSPADGALPAHSYVCPMPEHVSIEYEAPGQCALCRMTLVPVSAAALAKMQPGGKVEYYTCPMPEHSDVHLDQAGRCPKCAMTLIPVMPRPKLPDPIPDPVPDAIVPTPLYTCPMVEHAHVVSDQPGKCPECEMKLTESSQVKHAELARQNWIKQHPSPQPASTTTPLYTCPMQEHADVVSDQPGVCAKCEMKLLETGKVPHGKRAEENWRQQHSATSPAETGTPHPH